MKRFRRSLSVRIFRKYILTSVIFSVSMAVFLVISKVFLSRYIWYEDSVMYITVILIVVVVQVIQSTFNLTAIQIDKRNR